MMPEPILEIENLSVSFFTRAGEIPAVMDFSMTVHEGQTMGLVGESGCGKSTVALAIMRYLGKNGRIVDGSIHFKGSDITNLSETELSHIRGSEISMIYQEPMASLNPAMTIASQLIEVPMLHEGASRADATDRAEQMLNSVHLADSARIMDSYPHQLSGGQQQRIVIAMALLSNPDLLLLDEPTTALDVTVEAGIVELIKELARDYGTSMVFVSHNLGLILETCSSITVMYSGEAVEKGPILDVFENMRHPYTRGLLHSIPLPDTDRRKRPLESIPGQLPLPHERPEGCNFGPRCRYFQPGICDSGKLKMEPAGNANHDSRCRRITDIDWEQQPARQEAEHAQPPGEVVLNIHDLSKNYDLAANVVLTGGRHGTVKANDRISMDARGSETVAIVGESGCGKSTLAKVLLGLEQATGGSVRFLGKDISKVEVDRRDTETVGSLQMVFQNPFDTLNPSHSVGSQIIRTLEKFNHGKNSGEREKRMGELLDLVKLSRDFTSRKPRQLSGGQKQRIGIARAFAGNPKLVVADEPVSALDVSVQAAVIELLIDIQRKYGTTLLFISHDLSVVRYLADRVVVMYLGKIMEKGTTRQIFQPPYHPYTEALLSAVPVADPHYHKRQILLEGVLPSPLNPPRGCPFSTRCQRYLGEICDQSTPDEHEFETGHTIACHLPKPVMDSMEPVFYIKSTT